MDTNDEKVIRIFYLPQLGIPMDELRTSGKAGYHIHSDDNGVLGYRVYADRQTLLVPRDHVYKIVVDL